MQPRIETCQKCNGAVLPPNITMGWGGQICHCPIPSLARQGPLSTWNERNQLLEQIEHYKAVAELWKRQYAEECRKNEGFLSRFIRNIKSGFQPVEKE